MQNNFDRLDIRRHYDELTDTTVQRLGRLVGTLLELLVVRSLLRQIQDLIRQGSIRKRESLWVYLLSHLDLTTGITGRCTVVTVATRLFHNQVTCSYRLTQPLHRG